MIDIPAWFLRSFSAPWPDAFIGAAFGLFVFSALFALLFWRSKW